MSGATDYMRFYPEWSGYISYKVNNYPGEGYVLTLTQPWLPGMQGDFRDIRFSDGYSTLNYWIESQTDFSTATIHVKLGKSPTIFLHYGNGSAVSESNGAATFEFFEDWSGGWSTAKWGVKPANVSVSDGIATLQAGSLEVLGIFSVATFGIGHSMVMRASMSCSALGSNDLMGFSNPGDTDATRIAKIIDAGYPNFAKQSKAGGNNYLASLPLARDSNYRIFKVQRISASLSRYYIDSATGDSSTYISSSLLSVYAGGWNVSLMYMDWVYVKPYVTTEPTAVYVTSGSRFDYRKWAIANIQSGTHYDRDSDSSVPAIQGICERIAEFNRPADSIVPDIAILGKPNFHLLAESSISTFISTKGERVRLLLRDSGIFTNINELSGRTAEFHRTSDESVDISEVGSSRNTGLHSNSGLNVHIIEQTESRNTNLHKSSSAFVNILEQIEALSGFKLSRASSVYLLPEENATRVVQCNRDSGISIPAQQEDNVRTYGAWRYYWDGEIGVFVPTPQCGVGVNKVLHSASSVEIPAITTILERASDYDRAKVFVCDPDVLVEWEAAWIRPANMSTLLEAHASPNPQREINFFLQPLQINLLRGAVRYAEAGHSLGTVETGVALQRIHNRASDLEVPAVEITESRISTNSRSSGVSVVVLDSEGLGQGVFDRISEVYAGNLEMSSERLLETIRLSSSEIPETCIISVGIANPNQPHTPFNISTENPLYVVTVDKAEYGVELTKDFYYATTVSGDMTMELTQYDTDTFSGHLQDTDPATGLLRDMPLSGKTVKAILKGGAPDTTVTVNCTVITDGYVEWRTTSDDTNTPGKYFLKYVVIGTGFRKEIPENRDEYEEVIINDAAYIET